MFGWIKRPKFRVVSRMQSCGKIIYLVQERSLGFFHHGDFEFWRDCSLDYNLKNMAFGRLDYLKALEAEKQDSLKALKAENRKIKAYGTRVETRDTESKE